MSIESGKDQVETRIGQRFLDHQERVLEPHELDAFREQYRAEHLAEIEINGDTAWQLLLTREEKEEYKKLDKSFQAALQNRELFARLDPENIRRLDELSQKRGLPGGWLDLYEEKKRHTEMLTQEKARSLDKLRMIRGFFNPKK
jgi:hypothetical protein